MHTEKSIALQLTQVSKYFETATRRVEVLRDVAFAMNGGEALTIMGPSGSGKSTLLHLIGTLDAPSAGTIEINHQAPFTLPEPELAKFRNQKIGFIFQDHHLLPQFSVLENVLVPTWAFKSNHNDALKRAHELLERVGLSHRLEHRPAELSGGERQRVAIARALINRPSLLLCDEPTGDLDQNTANSVAALLLELHRAENNILIVVTHSLELAARFNRRFELREGRCVEV